MKPKEVREYIKFIKRTKKQRQTEWEQGKEYDSAKVICKCGRRLHIPVMREYIICPLCGRLTKNTSKARFKYLLTKEMRNNE